MKEQARSPTTLYVDLDGTFTKADLLFESLISSIKNKPFVLFYIFFWILRGRAYLKHKLSLFGNVDVKSLPLNEEFYRFLLDEKRNGRTIVLATASNEKFAKMVCDEFDIFSSYLSSDDTINLKGESKLRRIQAENKIFSYAGNSVEDFIIFAESEESYLVNPTDAARKIALTTSTTRAFDDKPQSGSVWLKQLRVHQWIKNILIFVPLFVSGSFLHQQPFVLSLAGFLSFSLLASATYILNDLLDLESDRLHPRKKNRPLASGRISIARGIIVVFVLFVVSLIISLFVGPIFFIILISYLILTLSYSMKLKKYFGIDVICLASLYTLRIVAGAAIIGVVVSFWLLSFSMFIFFSLAIIKRCAELRVIEKSEKIKAAGRDYNADDYHLLVSVGVSSSMLAVLMFCFYINSNVLTDQYQEPTLLWLAVPALTYWIMRMWIKTHRNEMHDDPIVFSLRDFGSVVTIGFIGLITIVAQIL